MACANVASSSAFSYVSGRIDSIGSPTCRREIPFNLFEASAANSETPAGRVWLRRYSSLEKALQLGARSWRRRLAIVSQFRPWLTSTLAGTRRFRRPCRRR